MTEERQPRLLIAARNLFELRAHHEEIIVALAQAGVQISIRYGSDKRLSADSYRETLLRRGCSVSVEQLPRDLRPSHHDERPGDLLAFRLRQLTDLLRYYHPDYRGRGWSRERWSLSAAPGPGKWALRIGRLGGRVSMLVVRLASGVDSLLPASEPARGLVASEYPDAVVTVGMVRNPELADTLKAAAERGIPTAAWIQSWDHLSSKGLLHFVPDRVFVWNEIQRDELRRYHGVPAGHVCVTGAQSFDYWFNGEQPSDRAQFCAENGIDPERPVILYLSSTRLAEPVPTTFFLRWLEAIRSSGDTALEEAYVLVRPHPLDLRHWSKLDRADPRLLISPSATEVPPHSPEFRQRYRDEVHHSTVAVGINTSAMVEAAILGKPVCTVEVPEVADQQRGTIHFEYLMTAGGGLLRTAATFDEHVAVLGELIRRDPYQRDERSARFVQAFVRPRGLDVKPGDVFSQEMIRLLQAPSERRGQSRSARALGGLIHRAAPVLGAPLEKGPSFRALTVALPTSARAGAKRLRHVVLIVLPLGAHARLAGLWPRRQAPAPGMRRFWKSGRSRRR